MTSTAILIPARYNSSRFPGKPLCDLGGKTMIERVYETCAETGLDTYVLTDDLSIALLFNDNNCRVDTEEYNNGTERCAGALKLIKKYDQYINVQGDMPDVTADMIETTRIQLNQYKVSTVCTMMPEEEQNNPNSVKLVRGSGKCLWFGRGMTGYGDWHLGIYGYKRNPLEFYHTYDVEQEERVEGLEQLRWLKAGWDIGCLHTEFSGVEINSPEDLEQWHKS